MSSEPIRRPIDARGKAWAQAIARALTGTGLTPNQISIGSVLFATMAGAGFIMAREHADWHRVAWLMVSAACIQLRLLCNLFDGMVAVEGGKKTKSGDVFNELPDRLSDSAILVAAGYAVNTATGIELGWAAALAAMLTAYVRLLGGAAGTPQYFFGPMAKQHRMAVMALAAIVSIGEWLALETFGRTLMLALAVITVGATITAYRRTSAIIDFLEKR